MFWAVHSCDGESFASGTGAMEPFSGESLPLGSLPLYFRLKILFYLVHAVLNKADSWPMSLAPTNGVSGKMEPKKPKCL